MARPIVEFTRGIPKNDREWIALFSKLSKHFKVEGNSIVVEPDITLPDQSVETNEIADRNVTGLKIALNAVSDENLRAGSAASVIGRASNTAGNVADIAASADGQILKRKSGGLVFEAVLDADLPSTIARDTEVTAAVAAHEGASDPHTQYTTAAEVLSAITAALTNVTSGTYTPTLTNTTNLDATTAFQCQYIRIDNTVFVSGKVDIDPTAAGVTVDMGMSLPIASNFGSAEDCAGTGFCTAVQQGAAILGDATNDRARWVFLVNDTANRSFYFSFGYQVI
jgi:hypothetical protein